MDRRRFLVTAGRSLATGLIAPRLGLATDAGGLSAGAVASGVLDALPGKLPLIKRSFRPPNYETPIEYFRHAFTPNDAFYVRWHDAPPTVALADWRLRLSGPAVQRPREFTHAELERGFETVEVAAVNQCSGNRRGLFSPHVPGVQWGYGGMGNATWRGVRLKDVLESAGLAATALEVVANGADVAMLTGPDFIKSLPMSKALDRDTLIAFEMNGAPLPSWNGFPARLIVPGWTATYWVKALVDLQVSDQPFDGFWMKSGYRVPKGLFGPSGFDSQDTEQSSPITSIKVNSLVVDPAPGARLTRGRSVRVQGIAWDGGSGVQRVETSLDVGASWREARLDRDLGRYAWRQWQFELSPQTAGAQSLLVRAIARDGSEQPQALVQNPAGYHHNVIQRVDFDVA
jgi:DMSO/TMAO reductase YedYZ molybdopterin-dependent catalytic subunit